MSTGERHDARLMNYSQSGLHLTAHFECCRLVAYQDEGGVWTIGYGHTLGVRPTDTCTPAQALLWLMDDAHVATYFVRHLVRVPLTQGEFDALVDFTFNCGGGALQTSTLLKLLNVGDYTGAAREFLRWDVVKGKHCHDLLVRRIIEAQEYDGSEKIWG